MTSRDLAEWMAYAIIEPFGSPSDYLRSGITTAMIHNVNRSKDSDRIADPKDFAPGRQDWEGEEETEDVDLSEQIRHSFAPYKGLGART